MVAARGTAGRAIWSLAQQTMLSILGTLAATSILAGLKLEWPLWPRQQPTVQAPASALPSLTSGGKFAARVFGDGGEEPSVTLATLPLILPMFTAPTVPSFSLLLPAPQVTADTSLAEAPFPVAPRPTRINTQHDGKHVLAQRAQPRGALEQVIVMAPLPKISGVPIQDPWLVSRSKSAYQQVAAWGGLIAGRLIP